MEQAQENISREEWLAQNTGWCERLRARVTPQQCTENRKRAKTDFEPLYLPCIKCSGITPGQTMEKSKSKKKEVKGKMTKIYCQKCGEQAENAARGLCIKCYQYVWSHGSKAIKQYQLKDAVKVGEEAKEQREPVAEPGPVGEPEPEPEAEPEPTQEDPLEGAELVVKRTNKGFPRPRVKVGSDTSNLYFNYQTIQQFGINKFKYAYFYQKTGSNKVLVLFSNRSGKHGFKISKKVEKLHSSLTISAVRLSRIFGWQGEEVFKVNATSREDVLELERVS